MAPGRFFHQWRLCRQVSVEGTARNADLPPLIGEGRGGGAPAAVRAVAVGLSLSHAPQAERGHEWHRYDHRPQRLSALRSSRTSLDCSVPMPERSPDLTQAVLCRASAQIEFAIAPTGAVELVPIGVSV